MALKISSYFLNQGREDARISGLLPNTAAANAGVYGGMVITQDPAGTPTGDGRTFKFFDGAIAVGATAPFPLGLAIEPSAGNNRQASGDADSGAGFDGSNYGAFGNVYSAIHSPGMIVDVYDDLRNVTQVTVNAAAQNTSCPFVKNVVWAIGDLVYPCTIAVDATRGVGGLLTNVASAANSARIGFVRAVNTDDAGATVLSIELNIEIKYA